MPAVRNNDSACLLAIPLQERLRHPAACLTGGDHVDCVFIRVNAWPVRFVWIRVYLWRDEIGVNRWRVERAQQQRARIRRSERGVENSGEVGAKAQ
jgi:hypothetical protein